LGKESIPFQRPTATAKQFDLESVALHEMGHLLGLGHSTDQNAAMYPYWAGVRRNLNQDDVDGIMALYVLHN
jgi:predicted Zn-dependent protease